jgi:hypothetical protein
MMNSLLDCLCITIDAHKELILTKLVQKTFWIPTYFFRVQQFLEFILEPEKKTNWKRTPRTPRLKNS